MTAINKVVRIGTMPNWDGKLMDIFAKVSLADGKLSISGVIGPKRNGDCDGSAGQFIMSFKEYGPRGHESIADITPAPGWDAWMMKAFFDAWDRWHLNDMKAGSAVQEEWLRANPVTAVYPESHYTKASEALAAAGLNPDADGYKYGHAWKREEVPAEVIKLLAGLPDSDKVPAWV